MCPTRSRRPGGRFVWHWQFLFSSCRRPILFGPGARLHIFFRDSILMDSTIRTAGGRLYSGDSLPRPGGAPMRGNLLMMSCTRATHNGQDSTTGCWFTCRTKLKGAWNLQPPSVTVRMTDVFTKAKRSQVMSRIRGRGNRQTEIALMLLLREHGICGWRRHTLLFGRPDFTFQKQRLVIFVDGCFWHSCPKHSNTPANNRVFWTKKLLANRKRDRLVARTLRKNGWRVIRIWEHELRKPTRVLAKVRRAFEDR